MTLRLCFFAAGGTSTAAKCAAVSSALPSPVTSTASTATSRTRRVAPSACAKVRYSVQRCTRSISFIALLYLKTSKQSAVLVKDNTVNKLRSCWHLLAGMLLIRRKSATDADHIWRKYSAAYFWLRCFVIIYLTRRLWIFCLFAFYKDFFSNQILLGQGYRLHYNNIGISRLGMLYSSTEHCITISKLFTVDRKSMWLIAVDINQHSWL